MHDFKSLKENTSDQTFNLFVGLRTSRGGGVAILTGIRGEYLHAKSYECLHRKIRGVFRGQGALICPRHALPIRFGVFSFSTKVTKALRTVLQKHHHFVPFCVKPSHLSQ